MPNETKGAWLSRKWATLIVASTAAFLIPVEVTVTAAGLPTIRVALDASFVDLQWIVNGYGLAFAALLMVTGTLGDRYGRRRLFVVGVVLFTVASLLWGLAQGPLFLNVAQLVQSVGAAFMFNLSLALLAAELLGRERASALGIYWGAIG